MRFLFLLVLALSTQLLSLSNSFASTKTLLAPKQDTTDVSFKVWGTASCKTQIESLINTQAGVLSVDWNTSTQQITITYVAGKTKVAKLQQIIADGGYDTDGAKATQSTYDALPAECKYQRE